MLQADLAYSWASSDGTIHPIDEVIFDLLEAVESHGSLRAAAREVGVSYRHAWAVLGKWAKICGQPLAQLHRGRGAELTEFGELLLGARRRGREQFGVHLDSLARELAPKFTGAAKRVRVRVHASHDLALIRLRDLLVRTTNLDVDLEFHGSLDSLTSLARGQCDIAGFHMAMDVSPTEAARFRQHLRPRTQKLIHFVTRRQGLMVAAGNPHHIRTLSDLAAKKVRFINRQRSSGTRVELDRLLDKAKLDPVELNGYQTEEFTHLAVAATIAGGMADAGFGIQAAAKEYRLDFIPLLSERYFLVCSNVSMKQAAVQTVIAALRGPAFRTEIGSLSGYDVGDSGNIFQINDLIPSAQLVSGNGTMAP